jgi:hypothetical protein
MKPSAFWIVTIPFRQRDYRGAIAAAHGLRMDGRAQFWCGRRIML